MRGKREVAFVTGDYVASRINFFHSPCHLPTAALDLAAPDVVLDAGRRSRTKCGTGGSGRKVKGYPSGGRGAWEDHCTG
jgi:hypothetical protein